MKTIDEQEFKNLVNSGTTVVQLSASWCGPCKMLTKLVDDNESKFNHPIVKVDIDQAQALAKSLGIRSVPTLIRFEENQETNRLVGNQPIDRLIEFSK